MRLSNFRLPYTIRESECCSLTKRIIVLIVMLMICIFAHSLITLMVTDKPWLVYIHIIKGAFSSNYQLAQTLLRMLPIFLIALGVSLCLKSGILNLGGNGSLLAGGIGASFIGLYLGHLPSIIAIPLTILVGMLCGALWSAIAGYLKGKLQISEIYTTVMMNYIMLYFGSYMLEYVWRSADKEPWSDMIGANTIWPVFIEGSAVHLGFLLAAFVFVWVIYINKTPLGYEIRALGQNKNATHFKLKNRDNFRIVMFVMLFSGALAGLAGAAQLCGSQYRFSLQLNQNYGFTGIVAARLGGMNPFGILITSLLFGVLSSGSTTMQVLTGVPVSIVDVLQGMLFITAILADRIAMYEIVRTEPKASTEDSALLEGGIEG